MLDLSKAHWIKSSRSSGNGQCVEMADLTEAVAVRDSKDESGPVLGFSAEGWKGFVAGVKAGTFNQ